MYGSNPHHGGGGGAYGGGGGAYGGGAPRPKQHQAPMSQQYHGYRQGELAAPTRPKPSRRSAV